MQKNQGYVVRTFSIVSAAALLSGGALVLDVSAGSGETSALADGTTCGPLKVAYVLDGTSSFNAAQFSNMKDQAKQSITDLSANRDDIDVTVGLYMFGREGRIGDAQYTGYDGKQYENIHDTFGDFVPAGGTNNFNLQEFYDKGIAKPGVNGDGPSVQKVTTKDNPNNAPLISQSISTNEGRDAALSKLDQFQRDDRIQVYGDAAPEASQHEGDKDMFFSQSEGTNWEAGLAAVEDSGVKYDAVIFLTDGAPNLVYGSPRYWDNEAGIPEGGNGFANYLGAAYATAPAVQRANDMRAGGTKVLPMFVSSSGGSWENPDIQASIKSLAGGPDAVEGVDYLTGSSDSANLSKTLVSAIVSNCNPTIETTKTPNFTKRDIKPGAKLTYTVTTKGTGNYKSAGVYVDEAPAKGIDKSSLRYVSTSKGTTDGSRWNVGELKVGEEATATVEVTVAADWKPGQQVVNAVDSGNEVKPQEQERNVMLRESDDVQVDKTITASDIRPGGSQTYKITARANGPEVSYDVLVEDVLPEGSTLASFSLDEGSRGTFEGSNWRIGEMQPGEELSATLTVTLGQDLKPNSTIVNDVYIGSETDPRPAEPGKPNDTVRDDDDNFDRTETTVSGGTLQISKDLVTQGTEIGAGKPVEAKITVRNSGAGTEPGVVMTDTPEGFEHGSVTLVDPSKGTVSGLGLVWSIGDLAPGEEVTVTAKGIVSNDATSTTEVINTASVEGAFSQRTSNTCVDNTGDISTDDDQCDSVIVALPDSQLQVSKDFTGDATELLPNGKISYKVQARNNSAVNAPDVTFNDLPIEGLDPASVRLEVNGETVTDADPDAEGFQWRIGNMTPNQMLEGTITANLVDGASLEGIDNVVTIGNPEHPAPAANLDGQTNNGDATADSDQWDRVYVKTPDSVLKIVKEPISEQVTPGEKATFRITVTNAGGDTAKRVTVEDVPGANFSLGKFVKVDKGIMNQGLWRIDELKVGEVVTAEVEGDVAQGLFEDDQVVNASIVSNRWNEYKGGTEANPDLGSDTDQWDDASVSVSPAVLKVRKSLTTDMGLTGPGGEVTFAIEGMNDSPIGAHEVTLTDLPVDGLENIVVKDASGTVLEDANPDLDGFQWAYGDVLAGARFEGTVTGNLTEGTTTVKNAVTIGNPTNPVSNSLDDVADWQLNNDDVTADMDQRDVAEGNLPQGILKIYKESVAVDTENNTQTYKISVTNDGPDPMQKVSVLDKGGQGIDYHSITLSNPEVGELNSTADGSQRWDVGTLNPGEVRSVTVTAKQNTTTPGALVVNGTVVFNPQNPETGSTVDNDSLDADTDQYDSVSYAVPEPEPTPDPEPTPEPEPSDNGGEEPSDGGGEVLPPEVDPQPGTVVPVSPETGSPTIPVDEIIEALPEPVQPVVGPVVKTGAAAVMWLPFAAVTAAAASLFASAARMHRRDR